MAESRSLFEDAAVKALSRLTLARASMRAFLKSDDKGDLEAWLLAESENGWLKEIQGLLDRARATSDPDRIAAIAACPTPIYHETHRYCPSCPWTEDDA